MTDEEILEKYKIVIEANIDACVKKYGFESKATQDEFIESYKQNFIAGFREASEEAAVKMFQDKFEHKLITKITGLSIEQVAKLANKSACIT